jgi:hypothetical protein
VLAVVEPQPQVVKHRVVPQDQAVLEEEYLLLLVVVVYLVEHIDILLVEEAVEVQLIDLKQVQQELAD